MQGDIFQAGVAPGGPISHNEVKLLVLYALAPLEAPISFSLLHEALGEHRLVNYFTLVEALEQLVEAGNLSVSQDRDAPQQYSATDLGRAAARELGDSIPLSLREKAGRSVAKALKRERRASEVRVAVEKRDKGYQLELAIPDNETDLLSLRVFAPTAEERDLIRRRFLNDPVYLYQSILSLLTGDPTVLGEIRPAEEELF